MVGSKTVISALALSALAAAAPAPTKTTQFSINQVAVKKPAVHPAAKYAKALAKYGATVPDYVASAAASSQSGSATNTPIDGDEEYVTPVTAGDSTLNLDFDTGSADLWVYTSSTDGAPSDANYYTPSADAKKLSGYTWSISYGDGSSASGDVYKDTVVVGGVTATAQAVEAAETVSSEFSEDTGSDGLLGLAYSSINQVEPIAQKTFYFNVIDSLETPVFAVTLKHNEPGTYDFGFIDSSKYTGDLTYADINTSEGYWLFDVDGYSVEGGSSSSDSFEAIADTGTTLLMLSDDVVKAYYDQVSSAKHSILEGGYVFDCDATLPDLSLTINGYTATVPAEYLNYASVSDSLCYGGLQSAGLLGLNILGDVFLKSQYVVFNGEDNKIGFAPQA
ncbi:Aspartic protease pep1 [Talaromyces atroroseus]|uniref:Aspartic protease pep1 n=1 Tax=Talaromyces atroroseus TaxID=1441469 RepID=A0A225AQX2_TALAT|nr:Aspartic protease pep1 [Talaromyces atroroseus]OKL56825.1 Aspartic protease pep1 [Talaromyces atroroseus]